ncbi:class I SAM-dependent methyltransferase [Nocardia otitidiscaviarum]|uniref:Class I SAM-dependent methyltransferase n=1 Tax=Nocardia otitidiscaviarum TaxID=1823 RepID=A0A516NNJ6_9NOCA|nr:class I SAM-dependent methyltransferase [Nocardia otitidiscaviarum]
MRGSRGSRRALTGCRPRARGLRRLVFDRLVEGYELAYSDRPEQVRAAAWLVECVGVGARVLDVGCGSGVPIARQLVDAGIQVVGIDISPAMISAAAAAVPRPCSIPVMFWSSPKSNSMARSHSSPC